MAAHRSRPKGFEEPNYTQVPNALFDLYLTDLGYAEVKILLVICRDTFGWHRKQTEPLSLSRLQARTGLGREAVSKGLASLLDRGLIRRQERHGSYIYEAVITEQLGLLAGGPVTEPPSSVTEPAASAASEPPPVGLPNQQQFGNRTPVKERKQEAKKNPPQPPQGGELDRVWAEALEGFDERQQAFLCRCTLVSLEGGIATVETDAPEWLRERFGTRIEESIRAKLVPVLPDGVEPPVARQRQPPVARRRRKRAA